MQRTDSLLAPILNRLGIAEGVRLQRIRQDWHSLFGETLSAHMSPARLAEGELLLNVDSPIWIQQLTFSKGEIVKKLRAYGVSELRFKIGRIPRKNQTQSASASPRTLTPEEEQFVDGLASDITDETLRDAVKKAASRSLGARKRPLT
jgi:hypothetical protein